MPPGGIHLHHLIEQLPPARDTICTSIREELLKPSRNVRFVADTTLPRTRENVVARYEGPVAPVANQVILDPGIGQFREFEPP